MSSALIIACLCLATAASMPSEFIDSIFLDGSIEEYDAGITGNLTEPDEPNRVAPKGTPGTTHRAEVTDPAVTASPSDDRAIEEKPVINTESKKESDAKAEQVTDELIALLSLSSAGGLATLICVARFLYRVYHDGALAINIADQAWDRVQAFMARIRHPRIDGRLAIRAP